MNNTPTTTRHQRSRVAHYAQTCDSYRYFNLLTSDGLFEEVESLLPQHRERQYPPTETLSLFLAQAMSSDRSCQHIVNQTAVERVIGGLPQVSTHTGGYCRARKRLPIKMVRSLTQRLGSQIDEPAPLNWRWNGRRVCLIDGTTVTMPDTADNQAQFPKHRGQKAGLGLPICRLVGITSLSTGALLDAAIGRFNGKGSSEQTLLRQIVGTFKQGDIVMGDAFFATWFFILDMQSKGIDIVMEQLGARRTSTDFRKGKRLGKRDHIVSFGKPKGKPDWMDQEDYDAAPETLSIREFRAGGKTMVTTMTCPKEAPKSELKALYKSRWNVELDLRSIKDTLGMNILSCKSAQMVEKEIWVYLLAYNLIRLMMAQSALLVDVNPRQLSFKHCLQIGLITSQKLDLCTPEQLVSLLMLIAQQRVANRPGRIEPRAVKRRPKPYPLLMLPRDEARENVRKYGHPKKLK
ncbi:MAG: IS4 family transposase [Gammaproteobacteria bacterium]|nr:MAG: IS4 family transposase [Gammaproteobacteria bacterium]